MMGVKVAVIFCLALFALTSSKTKKFAGAACKKHSDCYNKGTSQCECDEGICQDDPPFSKRCWTKYKYAQSLKPEYKYAHSSIVTSGPKKLAGDSCKQNNDCFNQGGSQCECDGGICQDNPPFSKKCWTKFKYAQYLKNKNAEPAIKTSPTTIQYKNEKCSTMKDCFNEPGVSKCTCPRGKCFGVKCLDRKTTEKKSESEQAIKTSPTTIKYKNEQCSAMKDCFNELGVSKCTCPRGKCFGKKCLDSETAKKAKLKAKSKVESKVKSKAKSKVKSKVKTKVKPKVKSKVKSKVKTKVKTKVKPKVTSKVKSKVKPKAKSKVKSKAAMKFNSDPCKRKVDKCANGCSCIMSKCRGFCKKSSALFGDFGDELFYDANANDMGYTFLKEFIFIVMGVVIFCMCCAFCIGLNIIIGYIGCKLGHSAATSAHNKNYKLIGQHDI